MNRLLKKIALPLTALAGVALTPMAYAEGSCLYYGLELGSGQVNKDHNTSTTMKDVGLALGCKFNNFLAVEGRLARDSKDWGNLLGDAELTRAALLGRVEYMGEHLLAYVNAGVGHAYIDTRSKTDNKTSLQWGVGLELFGSPTTAIYLGFNSQQLPEKSRYDVISAGFRYYFKDLF